MSMTVVADTFRRRADRSVVPGSHGPAEHVSGASVLERSSAQEGCLPIPVSWSLHHLRSLRDIVVASVAVNLDGLGHRLKGRRWP